MIPERTFKRRLANRAVLKASEGDAIARYLRVTEAANKAFGESDFARRWLNLPNPELEGRIPIELAETDAGAREVEDVIGRFAHRRLWLMPIVWRLTRAEFAEQLDGEGARLFGGRWNSHGRRALYTSSHLSLSVLEAHVHIPPELRDVLPILQAVRISIPDDANTAHVSQEQLVTLLESEDPMVACRATGDSWLDRNTELVLQVPSMLVPEEMNLILNPAHPRIREVKIASTRAFQFDARLAATRA